MSTGYAGTVVVVPTRNRADLAINAVRSALHQAPDRVTLLVSDNSTADDERERLAADCARLGEPRLTYVRPPRPLAMTEHWEWCLREAMARGDATHFLFLTDRMMFRVGGLREVTAIAEHYPERLVAYNHDRIVDDGWPIWIEEYEATGKLFELDTDRLLWLYSQCLLFNAYPRMLNSIAPRSVLERISDLFGAVFGSIAPDLAFCCRVLDVERTILFYDRAPMFHHALKRSHGATTSRGEVNQERADFAANLARDGQARNDATPIPGLDTAHNAVLNEYLVHRNATGNPRFEPLNIERYLEVNAREVRAMTDSPHKSEMLRLLVGAGYVGPTAPIPADVPRVPERARVQLGALRSLANAARRRAPRQGRRPRQSEDGRLTFERIDDAIAWARTGSSGFGRRTPTQHELLQGREIPL